VISIGENGEGTVAEEGMGETIEDPVEEVVESPVDENQVPSQVFGVIAYGADKRVTLVWEASTDDSFFPH